MSTAVKRNSTVNYAGILLLEHVLNSRLLLEASLAYLTAITLPNILFSCSVGEYRNTAVTHLTSPGIESRRGRHIFSDFFRRFSDANTGTERIEAAIAFLPVLPSFFHHIVVK
jgi:hypothetical protein